MLTRIPPTLDNGLGFTWIGGRILPLSCMQLHHLFMHLPVQCFMVGTHSRCLRQWENPTRDMVGFPHEVKIIHTTRGPKRGEVKEEIIFYYGKMATLSWDVDCWRWIDEYCFFNYTIKFGRDFVINMNPRITRAADKWQSYLPENYKLY